MGRYSGNHIARLLVWVVEPEGALRHPDQALRVRVVPEPLFQLRREG
jgi:hypothetical protein